MPSVVAVAPALSRGGKARRLRASLGITRFQLARLAGVAEEAVKLLEHDLPLPLDDRRRLLKELWARKLERQKIFPRQVFHNRI